MFWSAKNSVANFSCQSLLLGTNVPNEALLRALYEEYGMRRVGERQIQHKAKLSAIFGIETTLWVPYFSYSMGLGNALTGIENLL